MSRLEITTPDVLPEETGAEAALRPSRLDEFVGQVQVKASLQIAIDAAKARGEPLDHTLFFGPPGLGRRRWQHCSPGKWAFNSGPRRGRFSKSPAIS